MSDSFRQDLKDRIFLKMAVDLGLLGTCDRAHVGCVITKAGRAVSWGYNGAPPGMLHCDQNQHGWASDGIAFDLDLDPEVMVQAKGCRNATHAEANAICFAAREGISTEGGTLYVESTPCLQCSRLIIAAGIVRVMYRTPYRLTEGQDLLVAAGVEVDGG